MATIFNPPNCIKVPELNWKDIPQYNKDCDKFRDDLRNYLLRRKKGKYIGVIITFPVGDGYAEYMVAGLRPVELVHIPLGDAWHFNQAHLMTAAAIKEEVEAKLTLTKLFGKK